jgi:hypothetical protein
VVLTPEFSDGDNGLGRCNKLLPPNQIRVRRVLLIEEVSANDRYATNRASGHKVTVIIWKFRITVCDGNKGIPRDRVTQCPGKAWKPRWHSMIRYNCSAMFSEMWTVCTEYNSYWANFKPLSAKSREQAHWPKSAKDIAFEESLQGRFRTRRGISIASFPLSISLQTLNRGDDGRIYQPTKRQHRHSTYLGSWLKPVLKLDNYILWILTLPL